MSFGKQARSKKVWSERSQTDTLKLCKLEEELARFKMSVTRLENVISEGERQVARQTETHEAFASRTVALGQQLEKLETAKRELQVCRDRCHALKASIDALVPTPDQAARRARQQHLLAELAAKRVEIDATIDGKLKEVRELFAQRRELTDGLGTAAAAIDLAIYGSHDPFDVERFENLERALSVELSAESERWRRWLCGEDSNDEGRTLYRVRRRTFTIPETLASAHVYHAGDEISLTEEQAKRLTFGRPRWGTAVETDRPPKASEIGPAIVLVGGEPSRMPFENGKPTVSLAARATGLPAFPRS